MQKLQRLNDRMAKPIGKGGETDVQLLTCRKSLNTATKINSEEANIGSIYNAQRTEKICKKGSRLRFYSFAVKSVLAGRTEGGC